MLDAVCCSYEIGVTKVFLRANVMHTMEEAQLRLKHAAATRIQATARRVVMVQRFALMRAAAVKLHALARGIICRCVSRIAAALP